MKRLLLFLFFLCIAISPTVLAHSEVVFAVEAMTQSSQAAEIVVSGDDYQLPYPGLLPDNPLYPVKTLRDRIVGFLITDSLKKAEFNLLQADKRLQAGIYLIDRSKKHDLAVETISKGENYFEEAIIKTMEAKKQNTEIGSMKDRLMNSAAKHEKLITGLSENAPKEKERGFMTLLERIKKYNKEASKL